MGIHRDLVERVRDALTAEPPVREVKMFGGLAFMASERMIVSVGANGDLLVRADPERADELLAAPGARPAEMGAGRAMGRSWITVAEAGTATEEALGFWIDVALAYSDKESGPPR